MKNLFSKFLQALMVIIFVLLLVLVATGLVAGISHVWGMIR